MRVYARLWYWGWGTVGALAAAAGLLLGGFVVPVALSLITLFTAFMLAIGNMTAQHPNGAQQWTRPRVRAAFARAATAAVTVGAVAASTSLAGVLVLPLLLVAALTSPWFNQLLRPPAEPGKPGGPRQRANAHLGSRHRWRHRRPLSPKTHESAAYVEVTATGLRAAVETLDDTDLCRGWRGSFTALQLTETTLDRLELVNLRQAYLDEIERRHPAGLRAWLDSGARAASDPTRYLHTHRLPNRPSNAAPEQAQDSHHRPSPAPGPAPSEGEADDTAA